MFLKRKKRANEKYSWHYRIYSYYNVGTLSGIKVTSLGETNPFVPFYFKIIQPRTYFNTRRDARRILLVTKSLF